MRRADHGSGYGSGYGYGFGLGHGYGFGFGYGFGIEIGMIGDRIGNRPVLWLHPWPYIRVGCEFHHIDHWRLNWRDIADKHGIDVKREIVDRILREVDDGK
jgi:hypothetical protein